MMLKETIFVVRSGIKICCMEGRYNMKEFIEKLLGRMEETRKTALNKVKFPIMIVCKNDLQEFADICFEESKKIVNQLAEEYNGGWINADVESPTENGKYIVYYRKWTDGNYLPTFDETEIRILRYSNNGWFFPTYGDVEAEKDIHREVIAWQPLPEPFKPIAE